MKLSFVTFFSVLIVSSALFVPGFTDSIAHAQKKSRKAKKSKLRKKKPMFKALPRSKSGIRFLSFKQLASLHHDERTKYIKVFRGLFTDVEDFQRAFRRANKGKKSANLDPKYMDLIETLFGQSAHASEGKHGQGMYPTDKCIFAFHLSKYPTSGKLQPYECVPPAKCYTSRRHKTAGKKNGYLCEEVVSGLTYSESNNIYNGCIDAKNAYEATTTCDNERYRLIAFYDTKSADDVATTTEIVEDAKKLFGIGKEQVSKKNLRSDDARNLINSLITTRVDDRSLSLLVAIKQIYDNADMTPPTDNEFLKNFGTKYKSVVEAVDAIFAAYVTHCEQESAGAVKDAVRKGTNNVPAHRKKEEQERLTLLNKVEELKQAAKNRNFLQKDECLRVIRRFEGVVRELDGIAGSLPFASDIEGPNNVKTKKAPKLPDVDPVGCSPGGEVANSNIYSAVARCSLCAMKKSVTNNDEPFDGYGITDEHGRLPLTGNYEPSHKWTALLASMSKACGGSNGVSGDAELFNEMYQTFGHCSQNTYDWNGGPSESDKIRLEEYQTYNYWNGHGMPPDVRAKWLGFIGTKTTAYPDDGGHFARIFGISYAQATEIFCDPTVFDGKEHYLVQDEKTGRVKIKHGKPHNSKLRQWFKKTFSKKPDTSNANLKAELAKCKNEPGGLRNKSACRSRVRARFGSVGPNGEILGPRYTRRNRGHDRVEYAKKKYLSEYKDEIENNWDQDNVKFLACLEESKDRAVAEFDEKPGNMCMTKVPRNIRLQEADMTAEKPSGHMLIDQEFCINGHQAEYHSGSEENLSLGYLSVNTQLLGEVKSLPGYPASIKPFVDKNTGRRTLANNPEAAKYRQGLTSDYYKPYKYILNTDNYTEMTTPIECAEYWQLPDYPRARRNKATGEAE